MLKGLLLLLRIILAGVLVTSSVGKLIDSSSARRVLALLLGQPADASLVQIVVYGTIVVELLLAVWLSVGRMMNAALRAAGGLFGVLSLVLTYLMGRGTEIDSCGCFGAFLSGSTIEEALLRNVGLLSVAALGLLLFHKQAGSGSN